MHRVPPFALALFALAAGAALLRAQETPPAPRPRKRGAEITPLAYSTDASTVRLVPLRQGKLPDLSKGDVIKPTCGRGVNPKTPCEVHWLPEGDLLVIRRGQTDGFQRYGRNAQGRMEELAQGTWPAGWHLAGSGDVDGDGWSDLLLTRKTAQGYADFEVLVALGESKGEFHFKRPAQRVAQRQWAAAFSMAELTGDEHMDLLFHVQPHGGSHPVTYFVIPGNAEGPLDLKRKQEWCKGPIGASASSDVVLDDFNTDGLSDLLLTPDDDVPDDGQSYLSLSTREGATPLRPSVDFAPTREGWGNDRGAYRIQTSDVDLNGTTDLIVWFDDWRQKGRWSVHVYRGDGKGGFGKGELLLQGARDCPRMAWARFAAEF